ncbi:3-deoxy-D-manno-octulosonic acid kinase [Arenimonas soli]|uniref:3-deoxy-D-manno-octulosonic acid kinase n=1 Tax=Arenimonas soli TaxID=2269504 RepID=A0ABQ1HCW6_9GAMM|nr:3-deoxy-D-manno-octulosonic acid kinase [Arenimonas soli]GGA71588.1 3-deoxy-D-manno-octulosonic acid kinase [Arenimonas soli]
MGNTTAIAATRQPIRDARGEGAIVFDAARWPQATADALEPSTWNPAASPVAAGGRGAAWFVEGAFGRGVLRRYRRGGLAARASRDSYLWLGESRVRSFAEFHLLAALRAQGLPVPAPLLAGYWRRGLGYRAAIVVERIESATALAGYLDDPAAAAWASAGRSIARLHAAGVDHADLNAHNVLLDAGGKAWLIDFDRGRLRRPAAGWREANLARLSRSLAKLSGPGRDAWRDGFTRLRQAYAETLAGTVAGTAVELSR